MEKMRGIVRHAIFLPRVIKMEGFKKKNLKWSAWMRRRSATTGLIVEAFHMLHRKAGMLSDPERGMDMRTVGTAARRVAS